MRRLGRCPKAIQSWHTSFGSATPHLGAGVAARKPTKRRKRRKRRQRRWHGRSKHNRYLLGVYKSWCESSWKYVCITTATTGTTTTITTAAATATSAAASECLLLNSSFHFTLNDNNSLQACSNQKYVSIKLPFELRQVSTPPEKKCWNACCKFLMYVRSVVALNPLFCVVWLCLLVSYTSNAVLSNHV